MFTPFSYQKKCYVYVLNYLELCNAGASNPSPAADDTGFKYTASSPPALSVLKLRLCPSFFQGFGQVELFLLLIRWRVGRLIN